ncbi:PLxRFG domain-containing protein [Pararhodobacter sp.]|uniref:PLxRFG domain-containing protein n=1 Tax=Pararhodobacter sp. TaxID=2127056 RepID=UPI002FDE4A2A
MIRAAAGDGADDFLRRAREVGDELYPDQMRAAREQQEEQRRAAEPGFGGDLARSFGAGISEGVGSAVEGVGALADQPFALARGDENYQPGLLARMGRSGGDYLRDRANDLREGMSSGARTAIEQSTPGGDLTKPSTWTLGEGASIYGYSLLAADVLGSFLPVVAASVLTRSPIAGVGVGASQSAGAGAGEARGIIDEAFNERDPETGERLLERESPYYRELIAGGMDEDEALETTQNAAARIAALFNAPVGGFGGAATGAIIRGALPRGIGATGGPMRRALTRGALSASEEGIQEALEGVATRFGVQTATGMDIDLTEDTFGDFILGALGGGVVGGASGLAPQRATEEPPEAAPEGAPTPPVDRQQLALPAPTDGGTIFQQGPVRPPEGGGPRMVQVQLAGEGQPWGAEIVGGTTNTVSLRAEDGALFDIPRSDIESGAVQITPVGGETAAPPAPEAGPQAATTRTEAPEAIEPDPARPPRVPEADPAPSIEVDPIEEARKRLTMVEDQARTRGWDRTLLEMRDNLRGILAAAGRAEQDATNEASKIVTRKDGSPFKDQASATRALGRLGFSMDTHDIVAQDGGFVATPRVQEQEIGDAGLLDDSQTSAESNGGRRDSDPQAAEEGPQTVAGAEGDADTLQSPDGAGLPGFVDGAAEAVEPSEALTEPARNEQQIAQRRMAAPMDAERAKTRRRDANAFLDAAEEGERSWNGEVDGRMVLLRGGRARVRVNDDRGQDIITDTEGMSREDLAAWLDYATGQAQRAAPGAAQIDEGSVGQAADPLLSTLQGSMARAPETHVTKKGKTLEGYVLRAGTTEGQAKKIDPYAFPKAGGWFVRRNRADEFTGLDNSPVIEQQNTQQTALQADRERVAPDGEPSIASTPEGDENFAANRAAMGKFKKGQRVQWVNDNFNPPRTITGTIARMDRRSGQGVVEVLVDGGIGGKGYDATIGARLLSVETERAAPATDAPAPASDAPSREAFEAAAAETAPDPTPAQAEAENYKTGKIDWRGLTLSIENAKGSVRRKVGPDGKTAWEVTMPADYGRILRTKGADGDHVDFYMGPDPAADRVFVVDQKNAETGAFDEHKVMLGFVNQQQARDAFLKAFSDGKGAERWGAVTPMSVADLGEALKDGARWTRPMRMDQPAEPEVKKADTSPPPAPPKQEAPKPKKMKGLSDAENAELAALEAEFAAKLKSQLNSGLDPEMVGMAFKIGSLYVRAGRRRFRQLIDAMMERMGLTLEQAQPYARNAYNQLRDDMDLQGEDTADMDTSQEVIAEVRKMRAEEVKKPEEDTISEGPQQTEGQSDADRPRTDSDTRDEGSQPQSVHGDVGQGSGDARSEANLRSGEGGSRADPGRDDSGLEDAGGNGGRASARGGDGARFGSRPRNYRIAPGALNDTRGEKTRAKDSIEAIRLLKQIESQNRRATPEEQAKLALYAGAGSLNPAVPNSDGSVRTGWSDLATDLRALVSDAEMQTIARTTQYAFYTSEEVVRGMWSAAQRLGFKGGTVFEPGMGIGHFLGMAPEGIADRMTYRGVELDSITARIARQLYPEATVQNQDYTAAAVPQGFYDMAIGNPPFANIEIKSDKKYPQKFLLHDYFFAKTLDAVRPGGLLAFVTSEGTMNKMDDGARRYLAERADLVGAIRLPNTAFKGSAGTEVTTDVIFLRKRIEGEPVGDQSWLNVEMVPLPGLEGGRMTEFKVNRYFIDNPDMILGKQGGFGTQRFRGQYAVLPNEGENIGEAFAAAIKRLPADVITDPTYDPTRAQEEVDPDSGQTKAGSYYVRDGALWQYDGSVGRKMKRRGAEGGSLTADDYRKAMQFVGIRDALRNVYAADLSDNQADAKKHRKALNDAYDAFVAEHGPINRSKAQYRRPNAPALERARANQREEALEQGREWDEGSFDPTPYIDATLLDSQADEGDDPSGPVAGAAQQKAKRFTWTQIAKMRKETRARLGEAYREGSFDPAAVEDTEIIKRVNLNALMDDPEVWRIAALEKYDTETDTAVKGPVFTTSVVARQTEPEIRDAKDALNHSMATRGFPDIAMIAEKAGVTEATALQQLDGLVFRDPESGRYENRDLYLSGNVRRKLEIARQIGGPEMDANIRALEEVMPRDLTEYEVTATPGMPWIPINVMQDFAKTLGMQVNVDRASAGGRWIVEGEKRSTEATVTWGTGDMPFPDLLERVLNRTVIKVTRTIKNEDGSIVSRLDEAATQAANDKADAIRERFTGWVWQDGDRKETLLRLYNDRFNSNVAPSFDGSYLTTPGIAKGWQWRPHQLRAIARILQSGSTYLAHAVGAGKTSEMIAAAMEARRLGIARKPMFTVPNHMLGQFAAEFYEHYPTANLVVADDRRFHTDRRRQFIADAAANDYDAIILTHSSFQKIPVSDALNDEFVQAEIERFDEAIRSSKADGDRISTKEMERAKEKLEQRLRGARDASRADAQLTFEEMGVDMMFVDEAHLFRKLDFATQLGAIKGVTPSGSQMAWDLFLKTRHLDRINPGRGVVLASGTPITNTMAEVYTISRYIQHDTLEEHGMLDFDSWAQSYGETAIDYEPDAAGNYKAVSRFSKFVNTRDLSLMVRARMDTVIPEDLEKYVVRPKLAGGGRKAIAVPRSAAVEAYQGQLAQRMALLENRKGPPKKGDDNHLVVIGDGIASATDMRLIDPTASGRDSKLTRLAENVLETWKRTANAPFHKPDGATRSYSKEPAFHGPASQMVFADIQRRPGKSPFDTHEFIRDFLIRNGVPAEQIALFRDFKNTEAKRRLFRRVNDGEVRVLIGSARAMGTGVNAQKRLKAMHNLDPHWFPALDEQRVGRILRQGNWNTEIEVNDYATEGTYDSTMWQMMGRKARTIEDFLRGDPSVNEMEDVGPASVFEQLAGMTTPDPRILRLKELQETVKKLGRRRANTAAEERALSSGIKSAERSAGYYAQEAAAWEAVAGKHMDLRGDNFLVTVDGQEITDRKAFGEAMEAAAIAWADAGMGWPTTTVGEVNGVPILLEQADRSSRYFDTSFLLPAAGKPDGMLAAFNLRFSKDAERLFPLYENPVDTAKAITRAMNDVPAMIKHSRKGEADQKAKAVKDRKALEQFEGFKDEALLAESEAALKDLTATLDAEEMARRGKSKEAKDAPAAAPAAARESRFMDAPIPADGLRDMAASLTREVKASGLAGKVSVRLVRGLMDVAGVPIQGRQRGASIELNPDSRDGALGTLRHEIVHALRDESLWGTPYGLFTRPEWQGLVRAARADTALSKKVADAYPDLGSRAQVEEVIAEQYRRWAQNMDQRSGVDRAFRKIRGFVGAVANALRGQGFQSAAQTFDKIATGQIGERGPDGPGGQGTRMAESRDPRESLREWQRNGRKNADMFTDLSSRPEGNALFAAIEKAKTPRAAEIAADRWVKAMGRDTGVEHLVAFDRWGGLISVGRGGQYTVGMSDQLLSAMRDGSARYVTHNHPRNSGFSAADLANVALYGVDVSAVGHRDAVASARIGPSLVGTKLSSTPAKLGAFLGLIDGIVAHPIQEMLNRGEITIDTANAIHSHVSDMVKHRHGIIDLRSNGHIIVERHGVDADGLLQETDERVRDVLRRNQLHLVPIRDQGRDQPLGGAFPDGRGQQGPAGLPEGGREGTEGAGTGLPSTAQEGLSESQPRSPDGRFASHAAKYSRQMLEDAGPVTASKERGIIGQMLTDAMGGKSSTYNILALVPSEPLFQELGKNLMGARIYLRLKHALGAMRNERQATAAALMDDWRGFLTRNRKSNDELMNLMHDATIAGIDPARVFSVRPRHAYEAEPKYKAYVDAKREAYDALRPRWEKLPKKAQEIYQKVRDAYREASDAERQIILDNVKSSMEINLKRARLRYEDDLRKIEEDGLEGEERAAAEAEASERLAAITKRDGYGRNARLATLRAMFEQNEVDAPYFPLLRHGSYFVTLKDRDNKVIAFSKFESERAQMQEAARLRRAHPDHTVKTGLLDSTGGRGPDVDPNFVADIEAMIGKAVADPALMDAIWQRYLETLPDFSIRKSRLHRQGTPGYSKDAFRGYARQMFHSAHQLARLKYGMQMQQALDDAKREADASADPNRAMAVINEMEKRHEWVMNPKVSSWSTWATSAAFVYYLGATPAAALVNISQTVVVGIPVLAAGFERSTIGSAARHLSRALREFGLGKGSVSNAKSLKPDEKAAMEEAYRRGIIDKSQAHDLAGVAETGVEYSDIRARLMRPIAFLFHHAERLNREITFMAAYRMAKEAGLEGEAAIEKAGNLAWKTHFNYESDSRPRLQHNDFVRVATVFRNYQLNMIYRLFRDSHQSLKGATEADRKEARAQLIGITGMMAMMAGVSGTWGFALITTLAGLFMPGGADDIEQEVKEALVNTLGRDMAGLILNGVPGHLSGINLSQRMGMPELWFRRPDRQQEGDDLYQYWAEQMLGAVPGMAQNAFRGVNMALEGEVWRGVETASPKFVRDWMRSARYAQEGVTTYRGNPIIESVTPAEALTQALGFTPARVSEQYQTNRWMQNTQSRITDQRSTILRRAGDDIRAGNPISDRAAQAIREFNSEYPQYAITTDTIRQSVRARARGERETVGGVRLNRRLDGTIRGGTAQGIYSE